MDSLGVGFRYEDVLELCQKATQLDQDKQSVCVSEASTGCKNRRRTKNSFKRRTERKEVERERHVSLVIGGIQSLSLPQNIYLFLYSNIVEKASSTISYS